VHSKCTSGNAARAETTHIGALGHASGAKHVGIKQMHPIFAPQLVVPRPARERGQHGRKERGKTQTRHTSTDTTGRRAMNTTAGSCFRSCGRLFYQTPVPTRGAPGSEFN
jgi:hypothetical protein